MEQARHEARERARELARVALSRGDALAWFEQLYSEASGDVARIPWADPAGHPLLIDWLAGAPPPPRGHAAVVGCGLGEDAECLAAVGWQVRAFDVSPTAVAWCRRLHPHTTVRYELADLLALPPGWAGRFALVFESYTLQALPEELRARASTALVELLAPGGSLLVITRAREPDEDRGNLPWPLTRHELDRFVELGLVEREFRELQSGTGSTRTRHFRARYERPPAATVDRAGRDA